MREKENTSTHTMEGRNGRGKLLRECLSGVTIVQCMGACLSKGKGGGREGGMKGRRK